MLSKVFWASGSFYFCSHKVLSIKKRKMLLNFRVVVLAVLAWQGAAKDLLQKGALNADDECAEGESCGLNALQLRGASVGVPIVGDVIDELEDPDDEIEEADEEDEDEEKPASATVTQPQATPEAEQSEEDKDDEKEEDEEEEQEQEQEEQEDPVTTTTNAGEPHPEDAVCAKPDQQCGGQWYYGPACCTHGHICYEVNQYYSQCVTHEKAEEMARLENMTTTTTTTTNADPQHCRVGYEQCGGYDKATGTNYSGTTCCHAGFYCKETDDYFSQCAPVDRNSSFMPYKPTEKLEEPSKAPLFTFYVYRAAREDDDYVENINVGDLAGTLWYLHNEVVWVKPRKFGISRIIRYKISTRATQPLYDLGMNFGVRYSYDAAQCTGPWSCDLNYEKFGYFVGCNNLGMFPFPLYDTHYPDAVWYALPGDCSSKDYEDKDPKCIAEQPGGRCEGEPTGQGNCTYSIEIMGSVTIDEIEGISNYHEFIHTGDQVEYNKTLDKGVGMTFWDHINDTAKNAERVEKVRKIFETKFPDQATDEEMKPPACDFDFEVFYNTTTTTTTATTTISTTTISTTTISTTTTTAAATTTAATASSTTAASTTEASTTVAAATTASSTVSETTSAATEVATAAPSTATTTAAESTTATANASESESSVEATTSSGPELSNVSTTLTSTPKGCKDAVMGSHCYSSVIWAMEHGLKLHPTWYPGLTSKSTFAEFQERVHHVTPDVCPVPCTAKAGCHDPVEGESCYSAVKWAMKSGIKKHPHWYPGLTKESSFKDFQAAVHKKLPKKCMMPCSP
ncbi:Carbohydrate-binding domain-containing protein C2E1P3.05c [Symbiodinium microadriaticum]|uniref:Carbohydrate-binding domain-containing protein C2E1P3.05c n=1 Tax=Symbiodinium microadriaticum TaxID=2951 RepID=A0A1Q9EJK6_SYMMI|nr:Carbohydrate-binding domain-containing protein C2E1P3.05c [Symbiodinium microadriaticum]CAE7947059.1 unnamed protein product [Symbiodinium sp. KB8]